MKICLNFKLGSYGFEDVSEQSKKRRKRNSSQTEDKHLDSVVVALSSLASRIDSTLKKKQESHVSILEKSQVLLECEEYCMNFAKKKWQLFRVRY